jgi:hypothetical protein
LDTEILTIVVLFVNIGALVFVGVQTFLTRRALTLAEKTFKETQRTKEISDLPQGNLMLTLRAEIDRWKKELQKIVEDERSIKARLKNGDKALGREYGRESPEGIMSSWNYEHSPGWMQVIYASAAQYYFNCKCAAFYLSSDPQVSEGYVDQLVDTARTGVQRISEILAYVDERLPDWYLECPASMSESRFFKKSR